MSNIQIVDHLRWIVVSCSVLTFAVLSIATLSFKKPLKWWGIFLFIIGIELLAYFPQHKKWIWTILAIAILNLVKGFWIVGYRRKIIGEPVWRQGQILSSLRESVDLLNFRQKLGRGFCLALSLFFVVSLFFKNKHSVDKVGEIMVWSLLYPLILYYVYQILCIILLHIISPIFVIDEESKQACLNEIVMADWHMGKGVYARNPHIVFETGDCYVTYSTFLNKLRDRMGQVCEYTVYTDIFGTEFLMECPEPVSALEGEGIEIDDTKEEEGKSLFASFFQFNLGKRMQGIGNFLPFFILLFVSILLLFNYVFSKK
ncbi:MAG: hypothetical protein Q3993_02735 [Filifactor alocis]|nr:hypothetical protein [Filifactor alocis]